MELCDASQGARWQARRRLDAHRGGVVWGWLRLRCEHPDGSLRLRQRREARAVAVDAAGPHRHRVGVGAAAERPKEDPSQLEVVPVH
jgi:hypothetical protein